MGKIFKPDFAVIKIFFMSYEVAEHYGDVARARILRVLGQTRTVCEKSVLTAQRFSFFVHFVDKFLLAAAHRFGKRNTAVVGGTHDDGFNEFGYIVFKSALQKHLRTAHSRRALGNRYRAVGVELSAFNGVKTQSKRHNFANTGNGHVGEGIFLVDDLSRIRVHKTGALATRGKRLVGKRIIYMSTRTQSGARRRRERNSQKLFHINILAICNNFMRAALTHIVSAAVKDQTITMRILKTTFKRIIISRQLSKAITAGKKKTYFFATHPYASATK